MNSMVTVGLFSMNVAARLLNDSRPNSSARIRVM